MDTNIRSSVPWTVHKTPTMRPVKVELKTAPRIQCRLHEFNERPFDYHPMQIFEDIGALKTRDEPRS